jgi:hypothetical protein
MGDKYGYLIPENVSPDDYGCLLVFYPSDDLYRRELFGALDYFGTWVAWERDAAKRGILAASAWKIANEKTREAMGCLESILINDSMSVSGTAVDLASVITAIEGVSDSVDNLALAMPTEGSGEDVNTIVNVNCGCGCGGGNTGGDDGSSEPDETVPGGVPIDDYLPPVSDEDFDPVDPEDQPAQEDVCALVHYMLMWWRNTVLGIASGELSVSMVWGTVNTAFYGLFGFTIPKPAVVNDILAVIGKLTNSLNVSAEIDRNYETLQCMMLQHGDARSKMDNADGIIDSMSLPWITKNFMKRLLHVMPFGYIYSSNIIGNMISTYLPAWAFTRGCPSCVDGGGEIDPDAPIAPDNQAYEWVPVPVADVEHFTYTKEPDVNISLLGNRVTATAAASGNGRKYTPVAVKKDDNTVLGLLIVCNYPLANDIQTPPVAGGATILIPQNPKHYMYFQKTGVVNFGQVSFTTKVWNLAATMGLHTFYNSGTGATFTQDWYYLKAKA